MDPEIVAQLSNEDIEYMYNNLLEQVEELRHELREVTKRITEIKSQITTLCGKK
jgi:prefoldin subunit 5